MHACIDRLELPFWLKLVVSFSGMACLSTKWRCGGAELTVGFHSGSQGTAYPARKRYRIYGHAVCTVACYYVCLSTSTAVIAILACCSLR